MARFKIDYALQSKPGKRVYNEDYIQMHEQEGHLVFALADGLGGCGNGEVASSTAVKSVMGRMCWMNMDDSFLRQAIEGAQNAVMTKKKLHPEWKNMCTTLVLMEIFEDYVRWGHIGDSRLYMFRKGKVYHQTLDQSVPQMLVRMGELNMDQIRKHPDRNILLHTLGEEWESPPYILSEKTALHVGDAFLLCTDGFWEYVLEEEMKVCLRKSETACAWLAQMMQIVEKRGAQDAMDNYSAICVRVS